MNRQTKLWLTAAGVAAVAVLAVVVIFGISNPPRFPSLYDGGPTVEGTVAFVEYGRDECVHVLDVATGEDKELHCANWLWVEGWDRDGKLRIQSGDGIEHVSILDPETGEMLDAGNSAGVPPREVRSLYSTSLNGHATLVYTGNGTEVTLIEADGPRNYGFWDYGITDDQQYAWTCDSADRLLVVALDGSSGPWVVADNVSEVAWKG